MGVFVGYLTFKMLIVEEVMFKHHWIFLKTSCNCVKSKVVVDFGRPQDIVVNQVRENGGLRLWQGRVRELGTGRRVTTRTCDWM